ncbi:MAG: hypothetical protein MUF87_13025 [Anaerolineae bacterium]|jgi:hypothetical protein|nr:hypothetical protein [Anaerolineae bacterium]
MQIQRRLCVILLNSANQLVLQTQQQYWTAIALESINTHSMEVALTQMLFEQYQWRIQVIEQAFSLEHALTEELFLRQWYYVCRLIEPYDDLVHPLYVHPLHQVNELDLRPIRFKTYLVEHLERLQGL